MPVGEEMRSGGGAVSGGAAAQAPVQRGRWQVRLLKLAATGFGVQLQDQPLLTLSSGWK
jgi:hypothetical protein